MLKEINRKIMIAVDGSENAERAVNYVAQFLKGLPEVSLTLLLIVPVPPDDYFVNTEERLRWLTERQQEGTSILERYSTMFESSGFGREIIERLLVIETCASIGECILREQERIGCSTVVVGRRGISRKEEFIFGSTSNKILHSSKNCTVWIVE